MPGAESALVLLPRFTTLTGRPIVSSTRYTMTYYTVPLDVSRFGSAQFQVWRGPDGGGDPQGTFKMFIEESLDGIAWSAAGMAPNGYQLQSNVTASFSYAFRLRWFRLRIEMYGSSPRVTCWAEGILR